jgi:hypothetical protein
MCPSGAQSVSGNLAGATESDGSARSALDRKFDRLQVKVGDHEKLVIFGVLAQMGARVVLQMSPHAAA